MSKKMVRITCMVIAGIMTFTVVLGGVSIFVNW